MVHMAKDGVMKPYDKISFLLFGVIFWIAGTVFYRMQGRVIFESTSRQYWINFALTPIACTGVCVLLLVLRHVPPAEWTTASLLIALPGMFGEAIVLSRFGVFMPNMQAGSGGKYGALLFATYGLFLLTAELVTLRA